MDMTRRETMGMIGAAAAVATLAGGAPARAQQRRLGSRDKTLYWAATITPCNRNGDFDPGAFAAIMQWHKQCGADGVVVLGTSGEFSSFSSAERKAILEVALKNRNGLNIIVNPGTSNLPETIDLAKHAEAAGVDGMLVIPPYYFRQPPDEGLTRWYSTLLDTVGTPINPYHIPGTSGVAITHELLKNLLHYPQLAGIKDSTGNPKGYEEFVKAFPDLNMRTGTGNNLEIALDNGMGAILAEGNMFSRKCADVFTAYRAKGDWKGAVRKLNAAVGEIAKAEVPGGPWSAAPMRYMLSLDMGGGDWYARLPYVPLTDAQKAALKAAFERAKALG